MPEPVSTSELLLQRIADRLDSIDAKLEREPARPAPQPPAPAKAAKKSPSAPRKARADVDGR